MAKKGTGVPRWAKKLRRGSPVHLKGDETVMKSGTIELPAGAIPSPSGGKSSALDFTTALMQGNPIAIKALENAGVNPRTIDMVETRVPKSEPDDEASVADKFVASTYDWCRYFSFNAHDTKTVQPILLAYRQAMRQASKFVLDNEFTTYATHISNNVKPEKLLARLHLATLPYEVTWIEFDLHVKVREMRRFHGLEGIPKGVCQRMGILLERVNETMSTITMVGEDPDIVRPNLTGYIFSTDERTLNFNQMFNGLTPFDAAYRQDRLKQMPMFADVMNEPDTAEMMRRVAHGSLWGYGSHGSGIMHSTKELVHNIGLPAFLERHGELGFTRFYDFFENTGRTIVKRMPGFSQMISNEITEFSGMMRWLVCVLAMLNEVPTRTEFVQPSHTMRWGLIKRGKAFDYHRLTLRLPKTRPVPYLERKLSNVERKHKAHRVRQFWRTYLHVEHACKPEEHVWEYDDEHGYALCGRCFGYRRRIPEHVRGDPSLGWVEKSYVIKPSKQD
jgi:hypothetical protein